MTLPRAMRHAMLAMAGLAPCGPHEEGGAGVAAGDAEGPEEERWAPEETDDDAGALRGAHNAQGQAEQLALRQVFCAGRQLRLDGARLAEGNGLRNGMLTDAAVLALFGVAGGYMKLWGAGGGLVTKARSLPDAQLPAVEKAASNLRKSVAVRLGKRPKTKPEDHKGQMELRHHDFMLERLGQSVAALEKHIEERQLAVAQRRIKSLSLKLDEDQPGDEGGWNQVTRGREGGAPHGAAAGAAPSEARRPLHWAGFVITGAATSLPSAVQADDPGHSKSGGSAAGAGGHALSEPPPSRRGLEEWSVGEISGLLDKCGFASAAAAAREGGVDGGTFQMLDQDTLSAPPPDGLGLSRLQTARVMKELRAAGAQC
jgi:hypothetical protein